MTIFRKNFNVYEGVWVLYYERLTEKYDYENNSMHCFIHLHYNSIVCYTFNWTTTSNPVVSDLSLNNKMTETTDFKKPVEVN